MQIIHLEVRLVILWASWPNHIVQVLSNPNTRVNKEKGFGRSAVEEAEVSPDWQGKNTYTIARWSGPRTSGEVVYVLPSPSSSESARARFPGELEHKPVSTKRDVQHKAVRADGSHQLRSKERIDLDSTAEHQRTP